MREAQTSDVQLHIGESRDSGFSPEGCSGMTNRQSSNIGGGTKPPNSRSISSAILRRTVFQPRADDLHAIGRPSGESPIGMAVAGSYRCEDSYSGSIRCMMRSR
jgi:hypothetical protein